VASFIRGWWPITLDTDRSPGQHVSLYVTRLQENHFNSTAPLSRNLDVFGQPAPANYGVDPDTMEVLLWSLCMLYWFELRQRHEQQCERPLPDVCADLWRCA
jgi:hypothetical protein